MQFVASIKETSQLDYGRLDRLMGHILGVDLDDLIDRYIDAVDGSDVPAGSLRRDLERLQASVMEGKKGGRAGSLLSALGQLNNLVHLEIADLEEAAWTRLREWVC